MKVMFRAVKDKNKISVVMVIPTEKEKEVITIEMPNNGDWRADMECYDKVLSAYEERWSKVLGTD